MTNIPYHKLPEIYNQVAIGLCLTEQKHEVAGLKEMNLMNIPIIHNHSTFGLKWKNVNDIMNIIKKKINPGRGRCWPGLSQCECACGGMFMWHVACGM